GDRWAARDAVRARAPGARVAKEWRLPTRCACPFRRWPAGATADERRRDPAAPARHPFRAAPDVARRRATPDAAPALRPSAPAPARRAACGSRNPARRSEEHTSELQSRGHLVCRLLLEKKKIK